MMVYDAFRKRVIFAAMLPPCCHAPIYLYINVFRKIRGSVAAKLRKKKFFNSPLGPSLMAPYSEITQGYCKIRHAYCTITLGYLEILSE